MSTGSLAVTTALQPTALQPDSSKAARREFLSARWHLLAMLNWEIDPGLLEPLVPRGTELDLHAGKTYVSLVGFLFRETRLLGIPVPWHRHFEEVNLRFYLRRVVDGEVRRGGPSRRPRGFATTSPTLPCPCGTPSAGRRPNC